MNIHIELNAKEDLSIESKRAQIMKKERSGKKSEMERVQENLPPHRINDPHQTSEKKERELIGAAGFRYGQAQNQKQNRRRTRDDFSRIHQAKANNALS